MCLSSIGGQTAGPIMTKFGTYMRIDLGMVPTKKNGPTCGPEGWAHWDHSSERVLAAGGQRAIRAVTASR